MSFKALTVFAALLFTFALVNSPPAQACDTGGAAAGAPTFSFTAPQQVYAQQFVAAPVVTQQFVQRHVVQQ